MSAGCGNACGISWCCRCWLSWVDNEPDAIRLALDRGAKVYRVRPADTGLLVILPAACRHLRPDGLCAVHLDKPRYCSKFPDGCAGLVTLPRACPHLAREPSRVALEDMRELTMADAVDMLARRANVSQPKEAPNAQDPGD